MIWFLKGQHRQVLHVEAQVPSVKISREVSVSTYETHEYHKPSFVLLKIKIKKINLVYLSFLSLTDSRMFHL